MSIKGNEKGFTLIELLVVVAIIGILAAIAIPQYAAYKQQAVDSKMKSDLHNMATAMEAFYGSNANVYSGSTGANLIASYGFRQTASVTDTVAPNTADYTLTSAASGGTKASYSFSSATGQIQ